VRATLPEPGTALRVRAGASPGEIPELGYHDPWRPVSGCSCDRTFGHLSRTAPMFFSRKHSKREELLADPFPEAWLQHLHQNVLLCRLVPEPQRARLRDA